MTKIPVRKYTRHDGTRVSEHVRNTYRIPDRDVYAKPITKTTALGKFDQEFLLRHPIDFAHEEKREVHSFNDLEEGKWLMIDWTRGVGINYAMKRDGIAHIYTGRYYGADYMRLDQDEFNNWRKSITDLSRIEYGKNPIWSSQIPLTSKDQYEVWNGEPQGSLEIKYYTNKKSAEKKLNEFKLKNKNATLR